MYKGHAITLQFLHDEAFAAKKASAQFLGKLNADRNTLGRTKKSVLLANDFTLQLAQIEWNDFARVRCCKGGLFLPSPAWV